MSVRLLCCSGSLDAGGSERQLALLANSIDRARYQVGVYLLHRRGRYLDSLASHVELDAYDPGVERTWPWYVPGGIHRSQVQHLKRLLCERNIDVVYDRTFHMTLVTSAACHGTATARVSVIVSPPSQDFGRATERFKGLKRRRLQQAYSDPHAVTLAVSDAVASDAADYFGLDQRQIRVVQSPIDIDATIAAAQLECSESAYAVGPDEWSVVVVGRMSAEKGQRRAIDALARCIQAGDQRIMLYLVGDGPERQKLEAHVQSCGLAHRVRFVGFLENPFPLIARCQTLCVPSDYEGLPNVALEAMALKRPVVATPCSATLTNILRPSGGDVRGLVAQDFSANSLAQAFQELQSLGARGRVFGEHGYTYVQREHAVATWLEQMEQVFAESVSLARSHAGKDGRR